MDAPNTENPAPRCNADAGFTMGMPCLEAGSIHHDTTTTDLVDHSPVEELFNRQPLLNESEINDLLSFGVRARALWRPTPLRAGTITWVAQGRFEFSKFISRDEHGEKAFLFLVEDSGLYPFDIIAWVPQTNRIGSLLGYTWGLGEGGIYRPRLETGVLPVWRSPLDWLRANRRGVVLLKPQLAAPFLCDAEPLLAEDVEHGKELEKQLTIAPPCIMVPTPRVRSV